jgi:DNA invertase Pin-like site-specific DNA recombinase
MKIGYARISTNEQNPELQIDALKLAQCERIYTDRASGAKPSRPELDKVREVLRAGDILVVYRLDRLGRSLKDLIQWLKKLKKQEVDFESI